MTAYYFIVIFDGSYRRADCDRFIQTSSTITSEILNHKSWLNRRSARNKWSFINSLHVTSHFNYWISTLKVRYQKINISMNNDDTEIKPMMKIAKISVEWYTQDIAAA